MQQVGRSWLPSTVVVLLSILAARPTPGQAQSTIGEVDYSDTFTIDGVIRTDGLFNDNSGGAYNVEDSLGNPLATWTPTSNFSFNSAANSTDPAMINAAAGNPGAVDGVAQSGAGDFSFAYGLRTDYVVELDAILTLDRVDISSLSAPGATIFTAGSLSVFFRREQGWTGIGVYNGSVETAVPDPNDATKNIQLWMNDYDFHRFAVRFNGDDHTVSFFIDGNFITNLDLATFAGGIYDNYSNAAVGAGGEGYWWSVPMLHTWADNFAVGSPATYAAFTSSAATGLRSLAVDFDGSPSYSAGVVQSYKWDFGDGATATGKTASHTYAAAGRYAAKLTVTDDGGATDESTREIVVYQRLDALDETFDGPDGPVTGWTEYGGDIPANNGDTLRWRFAGGELVTDPCTIRENWIWAGDPPIFFPSEATYTTKFRFPSAGNNPDIGRHGGFFFCASRPTWRYGNGMNGYAVDWIDRVEDRGMRFSRWDNGAQFNNLIAPASPADPPEVWKVEVKGESIKVYGDDVLFFDVVDNTYRGGFFGYWVYTTAEELAVDYLTVEGQALDACFTASATTGVGSLTVDFDASCSASLSGAIQSYAWDFGDGATGAGVTVSHTYAPGHWKAALTIADPSNNKATITKDILVYGKAVNFEDDFERANGPVDGWTPYTGAWNIRDGVLATTSTTAEQFVWAGDPPIVFPRDITFSFTYVFEGPGSNAIVGRHGGAMFCADRPTWRYDPNFHGYAVDWIDRTTGEADRGIRLSRWDNGGYVPIALTSWIGNSPADPPTWWRIEVAGEHIKVYGDDVLYIDHVDATYRGKFFGFWTWAGDQQVIADDVVVEGKALSACISLTGPTLPIPGTAVAFSGACSEAFVGTIVSYDWQFGDGATASGPTAEHAYAADGVYTVKLTVKDDGNRTDTVEAMVTVYEPLLPFADCFERAPGPIDGWTAALGDWQINLDSMLEVATWGTEAFLYAGSPPWVLGPDFVAEVDWNLLEGTDATVGRHAALNFYWNNATTNRFGADSRGYSIFYIDRAADRGFTLGRWDHGGLTVLNPPGGTPAMTEPPTTVRIEVSGPNIRFYGDGTPLIDVVDSTYRDGLFALWVWNTNHVVFDNVRLGVTEPPECGVGPLEAPTNLRVTGAAGKVDLAWNKVASLDVQGYNVYRTPTDTGIVTKVAGLPPTAGTYSDTAVAVGKTYLYQVRAQYAAGESDPSNEVSATVTPGGATFRRGNADMAGNIDLTDAIYTLQFLFMGGTAPPCMDAADADDSGVLDLTDGISILQFLFMGGNPPPDPGPTTCGPDPTAEETELGCLQGCR